MESIFFDIGLIIIVATVGAYLGRLLKQPLIPLYIIGGIFLGPVLGIITDAETITTLAEMGIAFLLFMVGLEFDLKKLRDVGSVASFGGVIISVVLFGVGLVVASWLGFSGSELFFLGLVLAFSSTMIVAKILVDQNSIDSLHGRMIIGFLLMQDILAVIALSLLDKSGSSLFGVVASLFQTAALIIVAVFFGRYIFPDLFKFAARSQELLFLASLSVCFVFAIAFHLIGLSIVIGAFVAGITLAGLSYTPEIISRIKSLKDFFAVLFFVAIGLEVVAVDIGPLIVPIVLFSLLTLVLKPFVIMVVSALFGYYPKPSFLSGISLGQVSEFSLILVAQGVVLGLVSSSILSLTIIVAIITIIGSSYFMKFGNAFFARHKKWLDFLEIIPSRKRDLVFSPADGKPATSVLIGYDRIGFSVLRALRKLKKNVLVIDFNPDVIRRLISKRIRCMYGDASDLEILEHLHLSKVKLLVSTVNTLAENMLILTTYRQHNSNGTFIATANRVDEALLLYESGADYVILPHLLGGDHVSVLLEEVSGDLDKLIGKKISHLKELHLRRDVHPHHL